MARPKKSDVPAAGPVNGVAPLTIAMEEAIFMRDKFMTGLIRLESGITALRVAYAEHLNTFLPQGHPSRLVLPSFGGNYEGADLNNVAGVAAGVGPRFGRGDTPAGGLGVDPSKKKKRKPHDPNAPKRALTSYFLFMAENKPAIKAANEGWTSQQVSEESERRWQNITPTEKAEYEIRYQIDLCRYYKQKEAYEAGGPIPVVDAAQARALYDEQMRSGIPPKGRKVGKKPDATSAPTAAEDAGSDTSSSESEDEEEEEEEEEDEEEPVPPPVVERSSKRQKTAKEDAPKAAAKAPKGKVAEKPKPGAESTVAEPSKSPEKEKKKKLSKKKALQAADEAEVAPSSPTVPKEKKTRKRKSDA